MYSMCAWVYSRRMMNYLPQWSDFLEKKNPICNIRNLMDLLRVWTDTDNQGSFWVVEMMSSAWVRVPESENGKWFKLPVLSRHSQWSAEPEGGAALHYGRGAQAPRVIKNETRGLPIKLNGEKAALAKWMKKMKKSVRNPSLKGDWRQVHLNVYLLVLIWRGTKEAAIQNPQRHKQPTAESHCCFQPGNRIKTEQDLIPQMPVVRLDCRINSSGTHKSSRNSQIKAGTPLGSDTSQSFCNGCKQKRRWL